MRELKFRAWDNIEKKWLLGYKECGGFSIIGECMMTGEWSRVLSKMLKGEFGEEGEGLIIQQFTGIFDIHDVEICEGDILKYERMFTTLKDDLWTIKQKIVNYNKYDGKWNVFSSIHGEQKFEIIGNIFENPELIKN